MTHMNNHVAIKHRSDRITRSELRAAFALAAIFFMRMLGLFLILPVLALLGDDLAGATPVSIGLAIGIYGLTQALFQIPLGILSDRFGRKPIITAGLLLFACGGVIAALGDHIIMIIIGRALQGSGAIAAATLALAADLTRDPQRTKVMAIIGMSIAMAFTVALVIGPMFYAALGLAGLFWISVACALVAIAILHLTVPDPVVSGLRRETGAEAPALLDVLRDRRLISLDLGIFFLHLILAASFNVIPLLLTHAAALAPSVHWHLYAPALFGSLLLASPAIMYADRRDLVKAAFCVAVSLILAALLLFLLSTGQHLVLFAALLIFFCGFNYLEATLPSLVSRAAPPTHKGTALGVYTTSQFLGIFIGGLCGGMIHGWLGIPGVLAMCVVVSILWLIMVLRTNFPPQTEELTIPLEGLNAKLVNTLADDLAAISGVVEAVVIPNQGVALVKISPKKLDREALDRLTSR